MEGNKTAVFRGLLDILTFIWTFTFTTETNEMQKPLKAKQKNNCARAISELAVQQLSALPQTNHALLRRWKWAAWQTDIFIDLCVLYIVILPSYWTDTDLPNIYVHLWGENHSLSNKTQNRIFFWIRLKSLKREIPFYLQHGRHSDSRDIWLQTQLNVSLWHVAINKKKWSECM